MKKVSILLALLLVVTAAFAQTNLKIMSYNVRNGKGMDGVRDIERVAKVIKDAKADVVAVQELDSMTNRSAKKYVLGEIAALTNMHAEFFPAIEFDSKSIQSAGDGIEKCNTFVRIKLIHICLYTPLPYRRGQDGIP